jgi:thiosulfate/3-mercaptopyruvate sulfurtransferase
MRTLLATVLGLAALVGTALAGTPSASATETVSPLVSAEWVRSHLDRDGIVFLDVRGRLAGATRDDYLEAHVPGAIWTDYLKDGWRVQDTNGTVGQLPSVDALSALIGGLGIGNDDHVIVIPAGNKALDMGTATRIYWTFKVLGHDRVSILNGGMRAYTAERDKTSGAPVNPLESGAITRPAKTFTASLREDMLVNKADVAAASAGGGVVVDNRPYDQFLGINKHGKAKRAGTIPGAQNLPENWLTESGGGTFRDKAAIEKLYRLAGVPTSGEQITFCNTGHWASLGWFASHEILGNRDAKLYDGSMVEWSADPSLTVQSAIDAQ